MDKFYIYFHYKKGTDEIFYVGKGINKRGFEKTKRNKHWKNIVAKYDFTVKIVENNLSEEEAFKLEKEYIKKFGRRDLGTGILVNMTDGGEGICGQIFSEKHKQRISESHKGKIVLDETKEKLRAINLGKKHTEETKKKMSERMKGNLNTLGFKHSEESKKKIGLASKGNQYAKGNKLSEETKNKMRKARLKYLERKSKLNI